MKDNQFYPTPWRVAEQAAALFKGQGLLDKMDEAEKAGVIAGIIQIMLKEN